MNISYNWLKEYLSMKLNPQEVSDALTSIGLETGSVDEVQTIRGGLQGLVVGKVITCVDHENSDHLHVTTVDVGSGEPLQIVCGAANVAAGQNVIVATVGTTLYSGEESFAIKRSKIRGVESLGMICAEDEIGIGDSHDGIMVLPADAVVGTSAADYFNVQSDYVLEVDITPNRIDAASHYGVARDLAAYLNQNGEPTELRRPSVEAFAADPTVKGITVEVLNPEAAPRYAGVTIRGIQVKESPDWLKNRLLAIGLRPINNVVDITNYILHETGQPLHCFDLKTIRGERIVVRNAEAGSLFVTLDGAERKLAADDLMICDNERPHCIAGVFGGLESGVSFETTDIFLESAYFHPTRVRKTARRHGLNTDSSFRFERGCDPNNIIYVLKRAALLIQELAGGIIAGDLIDNYPQPIEPATVSLRFDKVDALIGKGIARETICSILRSLEIEIVSSSDESLELRVPTYRVDVQRDVDVIEDILRIYGYNNIEIPQQVVATLANKGKADFSHKLYNLLAEQLVGAGYQEILNNSLTKGGYYTELESFPVAASVPLLNPLSSDLNVMRQTLLFGGLESIAYNRNRKSADLQLFEFGNCYTLDLSKENPEQPLAIYAESTHLALWSCGNRVADSWAHSQEAQNVFVLKGQLENLFLRAGVQRSRLKIEEFENELFSQGLRYLTTGGKIIVEMGILRKKNLKSFDIDTEVYYADLNWNLFMKEAQKSYVKYEELSKYPAVRRDLALLIDRTIRFDQIRACAERAEKKLLREVKLFDVYEGNNLPEGKKSYAVSFLIQDETKTLADKQIEAIMTKIQSSIESELGARLR